VPNPYRENFHKPASSRPSTLPLPELFPKQECLFAVANLGCVGRASLTSLGPAVIVCPKVVTVRVQAAFGCRTWPNGQLMHCLLFARNTFELRRLSPKIEVWPIQQLPASWNAFSPWKRSPKSPACRLKRSISGARSAAEFPFVRLSRNRVRYRQCDLDEFIEANTIAPVPVHPSLRRR